MKRRGRKDLERFNAKYRRGRGGYAPPVGDPEAVAAAGPRRKVFSWIYFFCIPALMAFSTLCFFVAYGVSAGMDGAGESWLVFIAGTAVSLLIWSQLQLIKIRTLIHEFKHAMAVMFAGGKVDRIAVDDDGSGQIEYTYPEDAEQYAPIIALAPYCFPLLSFPALLAALVSPAEFKLYYAFGLGLAFASDFSTGIRDLGPHQSDIEDIVGRFYLAGMFLAAAHFAWFSILAIWVGGGRQGYAELWQMVVRSL